jgi:hypothetical protein
MIQKHCRNIVHYDRAVIMILSYHSKHFTLDFKDIKVFLHDLLVIIKLIRDK